MTIALITIGFMVDLLKTFQGYQVFKRSTMNPIVIKAILKFCTTKQLFKLSWSGDSNENFRSSSQAALSQVGGFTLSLSVTERQAGKL